MGELRRVARRRIDVLRQITVETKLRREINQERMLLLVIEIDRNTRGRENLDRFLLRPHTGSKIRCGRRIVEFVGQEFFRLRVKTNLLEAAKDFLLLSLVDAAVSGSSGNHRADVKRRRFTRHRTHIEPRTLRSRDQARIGTCQQRTASLIILQGLVSQTTDQRETTDFCSACRNRPASFRAEHDRAETTRACSRSALIIRHPIFELRQNVFRRLARSRP